MPLIPKLVRLTGSAIDRVDRAVSSLVAGLRLKARGASIGPGLVVRGRLDLYVHERGRVTIGARCRINSGFRGNAVGGFRRAGIWVSAGAHLQLGDDVGLSGCTIVCTQAVTIGSETMIGGDCQIYDTDFHPVSASDRIGRLPPKSAPVTLGRRCFIGGHSIILKGVTIGEEAVVGAGSVVTRSIPAGEIWAGNPAKRISDHLQAAERGQ